MNNKEKIYDEKIYPLMAQVIDICKKSDMQIIFSCYLGTDENGDLSCDTYLESQKENCELLKDAAKVIRLGYVAQKPYVMTATITEK